MQTAKCKSLTCLFGLLFGLAFGLSAQDRYALVIGNGAYGSVAKLKNPVNDASDMANALKGLGFKVDLIKDAGLDAMENAVIRLGNNLGQSPGAYGFFFYAGHGVQSNGINYLIPVDADIKSESFLKNRALAMQEVLDTLQQAGNGLNVIVLDACRDNPFSWARGGTRGLSVVGSQPSGSIIVYATSAGSTAQDGTGRNGLFTSQLLGNIRTPGLEIKDVFNKTGADVMAASGNKQIPAVFTQFFKTAYLAGTGKPVPEDASASVSAGGEPEFGTIVVSTGALSISLATAGTLELAGKTIAIPASGTLPVNKLVPGDYQLKVTYADGKKETKSVRVISGQTVDVAFGYAQSSSAQEPKGRGGIYAVGDTGPAGGIVFYDKGSESDGWRYLEAAPTELAGYFSGNSIRSYAEQYSGGDAHDWRLPSIEELKLIQRNLYNKGLGKFRHSNYWSSSADGHYLNFVSGVEGWSGHSDQGWNPSALIRPVRQF